MSVPILMPDLGVPSAILSLWFVADGDDVDEGERLIEILAGAATFDIAAPVAGRLASRNAFPGERLANGQVLGYIDVHLDH